MKLIRLKNCSMRSLESSRVSYAVTREVICAHIAERTPFSLIRIGDGESVILDWPELETRDDLGCHLELWFGTQEIESKILRKLKARLERACRKALVLGVPTTRQTKIHNRYKVSYSHMEVLLKNTSRRKIVCDAAVHRYMHLSGDIVAWLQKSEFIGLVTSCNIAGEIEQWLRPFTLASYRIPMERRGKAESAISDYWWLPNTYESLRKRIYVPYRGAPFLVGGGLMGKLICEDIRQK